MHSCGQLKLKCTFQFSWCFWHKRTQHISWVENWQIKHLCNMQLAVISANAQHNYAIILPLIGGSREIKEALSHSSRCRRRMGTWLSRCKSKQRDWVEFAGWCQQIPGVFAQVFVCLYSLCGRLHKSKWRTAQWIFQCSLMGWLRHVAHSTLL